MTPMEDIIGHVVFGHDNDSYMLTPESGPRCAVCRQLTSRPSAFEHFKLRRKRDISCTYDGYPVVSQRFVDFCREAALHGLIFTALPRSPGYHVIEAATMLSFDLKRRKSTLENCCSTCGRFESITGVTPAYLCNPDQLLPNTFYRSDVEFGSGDAKSPLLFVDRQLGKQLKDQKFSGLDLHEILR